MKGIVTGELFNICASEFSHKLRQLIALSISLFVVYWAHFIFYFIYKIKLIIINKMFMFVIFI